MGILTLEATLVELPPAACDLPAFPSATTSIPFTLNGCPKGTGASTGAKTRNVQSAGAFVALSGVGASDDVTQADTFYARVSVPGFQVRLTFHNPAGAAIVSVLPLAGVLLLEPDALGGFYLTLVEVQGVGTVEYFASGQQ